MKESLYTISAGTVLAVCLWMAVFYLPGGSFWIKMSAGAAAASGYAFYPGRAKLKQLLNWRWVYLLYGILSAGLLYMIFFAGGKLSELVFNFAADQIASVYSMKQGGSELILGALLFLVIAPGEEIFWRGFLQEKVSVLVDSKSIGYIAVSLLYGAVHLWAVNFMLFMAALVCGFFWGYVFNKTGGLWPGIISHSIWDVAIFILFPV
ncbi:MAG: CPBP family intramembrane glutamic endopeptidase [Spirochaetota bacterium]